MNGVDERMFEIADALMRHAQLRWGWRPPHVLMVVNISQSSAAVLFFMMISAALDWPTKLIGAGLAAAAIVMEIKLTRTYLVDLKGPWTAEKDYRYASMAANLRSKDRGGYHEVMLLLPALLLVVMGLTAASFSQVGLAVNCLGGCAMFLTLALRHYIKGSTPVMMAAQP